MIKQVFDTYGAAILISLFVLLFILESRFDLRRRVSSRWKRILINFVMSIPAFALLRLLFIPAVYWLAVQNEVWHFGLNYLLAAPPIILVTITFLLLDYSNYLWHILLHKLPVLWRFHVVHHSDLDMDISTAFRFHFGEMIGSVIYRGAAILLIGASPLMVLIYEIAFEAATQFHHSNTRLPLQFERVLNYLVVTPRMHGIHHSVIRKETDSNYSVIFSFWDRMHRTLRLNIHQHDVVIGLPQYQDEKELTIGHLLKMPFKPTRKPVVNERITDSDFTTMKR